MNVETSPQIQLPANSTFYQQEPASSEPSEKEKQAAKQLTDIKSKIRSLLSELKHTHPQNVEQLYSRLTPVIKRLNRSEYALLTEGKKPIIEHLLTHSRLFADKQENIAHRLASWNLKHPPLEKPESIIATYVKEIVTLSQGQEKDSRPVRNRLDDEEIFASFIARQFTHEWLYPRFDQYKDATIRANSGDQEKLEEIEGQIKSLIAGVHQFIHTKREALNQDANSSLYHPLSCNVFHLDTSSSSFQKAQEEMRTWWLTTTPEQRAQKEIAASLGPMAYFAKEMQIARKRGEARKVRALHLKSSLLFNRLIKKYLIELKSFDRHLKFSPEIFIHRLKNLEHLKKFFYYGDSKSQDTIKALYGRAEQIDLDLNFPQPVGLALKKSQDVDFTFANGYPTERYQKALADFRHIFAVPPNTSPENVRRIQENNHNAFKRFFRVLLKDAFVVLGPPPCDYDIQAMGSCGREEMAVFSDLEPLILIEDPDDAGYFILLLQFLNLQIYSLGETATATPAFTCLGEKNTSGFHLDLGEKVPVYTPQQLIKKQLGFDQTELTNSLTRTAFHTISLCSSTKQLHKAYLDLLHQPKTIAMRQERSLHYLHVRVQDYKIHLEEKRSHTIFHLKEEYTELLNHLLSDLALFFGVFHTNPLDIVDQLTDVHNVFTHETTASLKQAIATIYAMRTTIHELYGQQKEQVQSMEGQDLIWINESETTTLKQIYWGVITPLYFFLLNQTLKVPDVLRDDWWQELHKYSKKFEALKYAEDAEQAYENVQGYYGELNTLLKKRLSKPSSSESWNELIKPFYKNLLKLIASDQDDSAKFLAVATELAHVNTGTEDKTLKVKFKQNKRSLLAAPIIEQLSQALQSVDLSEVAFQQHLPKYRELISQANGAIAEQNKDNLEQVRIQQERYLNKLRAKGIGPVADRLAQVPDRSGFRVAFRLKKKELEAQIQALFPKPEDETADPKVKVRLSSLEERCLALNASKEIINERTGYFKPNRDPSRKRADSSSTQGNSVHNVHALPAYKVHLKERPYQPLMEYAVHNLLYRIFGDLTPPTALVRFDVHGKTYPVLISQTVEGPTLEGKTSLHGVDRAQWSRHILATILTLPADGRHSNYILSGSKIYCVDNDMSLLNPFQKGIFIDTTHFCSVLFSLDNEPLDQQVLEEFCELDIDAILNAWLDDLIEKEAEYGNSDFFSKTEYENLRTHPEEKDEEKKLCFHRNLLIRKGQIRTLYVQFWKLQHFIREELFQIKFEKRKDHVTPDKLLKQLIILDMDGDKIRSILKGKGKAFESVKQVGEDVAKQLDSEIHAPSPMLKKKAYLKRKGGQSHSATTMNRMYKTKGGTKNVESLQEVRKELNIQLKRKGMWAQGDSSVIERSFEGFTDLIGMVSQWIELNGLINDLKRPGIGKPSSVKLTNCHELSTQLLLPFISEALTHLNLNYSTYLQNHDIVHIANCENLKTLSIRGCRAITEIAKVIEKFPVNERDFLIFPSLERIDMSECESLKSTQLDAPLLTFGNTSHNTIMTLLDLKTNSDNLGWINCTDSTLFEFKHDFAQKEVKVNQSPQSSIRRFYLFGMLPKAENYIDFRDPKDSLHPEIASIPTDIASNICSLRFNKGDLSYTEIQKIVTTCPNLTLLDVTATESHLSDDQVLMLISCFFPNRSIVNPDMTKHPKSQKHGSEQFCEKITIALKVKNNLNYRLPHNRSTSNLIQPLIIPNSLPIITVLNINSCHHLKCLELPNALTALTTFEVGSCKQLKSIRFPSTLTSLETLVLQRCNQLKTLSLPATLPSLTAIELWWCTRLTPPALTALTSLTKLDLVEVECSACQTLHLPKPSTALAMLSLEGCNHLQSVILNDSLVALTALKVKSCSDIKALTFPERLPSLTSLDLRGCHEKIKEQIPSIKKSFPNCAIITDEEEKQ